MSTMNSDASIAWRNNAITHHMERKAEIRRAIIRENAATEACAMEIRTFGDTKFTAAEYKEARTHRLALEAN